jgi:ATP-binding cassette, subfamily B, bacterial PglK
MSTFKKFLFLLSYKERKRARLLFFIILVMALLDMIGVVSILPFMAALTNPGLIETNSTLNKIFEVSSIFGVENNQEFLFTLGLSVFILLVVSLMFKAYATYIQIKFVQMSEFRMGKMMVERYLRQPYSWFLNRNSADLGKTILSEVGAIVAKGIRPFIEVIAKGTIAILLIILLVIADPKLALIVGISFSLAYGIIFYFIRGFLNRIGEKSLKNNELRFMSVSEAFGAVKEVKIGGLEKIFIKIFSDSAKSFAKTQALVEIIAQLPRYILEIIAFGGILLIILYLISQFGTFNESIPILSLYVFAGYRLMPALQQIYASFTKLAFVSPSLDKLYYDLKSLKNVNEIHDEGILSFNKMITLKNICYNYPKSSRTALRGINLSVPVKSIVGLVGATGSGKTTTVDIILGLLEPQKGILEVDDQAITKQNIRSWQRSIGYVPQHIYLSDDTLAANIAFGIEPKYINQEAIERASKIASLHEFVINELPEKYETTIGERGVRLSGGQRQRIGIARALYNKPQILILDEATSALDNNTERAVMDAVNNLNKEITIILIAHRLDTVKNCDKIFLLEKGELKDEGSFDELLNKELI